MFIILGEVMSDGRKEVFAMFGGVFALIVFSIVIAAALFWGWVMCIYKFADSDFEPSYKREIVYAIGAITGTGCIIGYFDIPDTNNNQIKH